MNKNSQKRPKQSLKTKAARGAGINIGTQVIGFGFHMFGVIILARLLKPEDFGIVAMVTAFSIWVMNFGVNGFTEYIIQKPDINNSEINSIFWLNFILALFFVFSFIIFGYYLIDFYNEPALQRISAVLAIGFIFQSLYTCHFAILKKNMQFKFIALTELGALIGSIIFAIIAASFGMGYWSVVIRQMAIPVTICIATWIYNPWRPRFPIKINPAFKGLKYALKVYSNFSLGYLTRNIDKVLLGKFHGSEILGNYDRAFHLSSLPAGQILTPLHSVMLSTLSQLIHEEERYKNYFLKALAMVSFLGTAGAMILTLTAKDLVVLLLGKDWIEAGKIVMVLGPGIAAMLVYGTNSWLHLSLGKPERWLRWNIFISIFTVIIFAIAAPYGAMAMAMAFTIRAYIFVLPSLWYAALPIKIKTRSLISAIYPYYTAGFIVFVSWINLSDAYSPLVKLLNHESLLYRIGITGCYTIIVYILIIIILQRGFSTIRETMSIINIIVGRK